MKTIVTNAIGRSALFLKPNVEHIGSCEYRNLTHSNRNRKNRRTVVADLFTALRKGLSGVDQLGSKGFMYSSDYPHSDMDWNRVQTIKGSEALTSAEKSRSAR